MCGKRLKVFFLLSGLSLLLPFVHLCSYSYADVILSNQEAEELMNEIQLSKTELENVKNELTESKKELSEQKTQLEDVKNTYTEQKQSYEKQLEEAEKENNKLKTWLTVTATSSVISLVFVALLLLF